METKVRCELLQIYAHDEPLYTASDLTTRDLWLFAGLPEEEFDV